MNIRDIERFCKLRSEVRENNILSKSRFHKYIKKIGIGEHAVYYYKDKNGETHKEKAFKLTEQQLQKIKDHIEAAGGVFIGIQKDNGDSLVMFNDTKKEYKSTMAIEVGKDKEITADEIKKKIHTTREKHDKHL